MPEPLTLEDSKALLALCRAGKLFEIERWITAGKSIVTAAMMKKTPLLTAVDSRSRRGSLPSVRSR
jgi:hypothetical protein